MLIKCTECGAAISDQAFACPHCGFPLSGYQQAANTGATEAAPDLFKTSHIGNDVLLTQYTGYDFITDLTLPADVTVISSGAFKNCKALRRVALPAGLREIGSEAFSECSALKTIDLPETLVKIGDKAFYFCQSLEEISFPAKLTHIGKSAFSFTGLKRISLPPFLEVIEEAAFSACVQLQVVALPQYLKCIKKSAFYNCKISKIFIPQGTVSIQDNVFGSTFLHDIYIPPSVCSIGPYGEENSPYRIEDMFPPSANRRKRMCKSEYGSSCLTIHCASGSFAMEFARQVGAKTMPL